MDPDARELLKQAGLTDFRERQLDVEPPRPVDTEKVRAYLENELPPLEAARVGYLIANYKAWDDMRRDLVLERAKAIDNRERFAAAIWLQWMMRKRALMIASVATLLLLLGLFLFQAPAGGLRDGSQQVAYRNGTVTGLEAYDNKWSSKASAAFSTGLELPAGLQEIDAAQPDVRGGLPRSAVLVLPYGSAVREARPVFEWWPFANILEYTIELRNVQRDELFAEVADVAGIEQQQPIRIDRELESGQIYQWKLKYDHNGVTKELPRRDQQPALFRVLTSEELEALHAAEQQIGESQLLLFLLYVEYGLLHEAEVQLEKLRQQNPNSELMRTLDQHWEEFQNR